MNGKDKPKEEKKETNFLIVKDLPKQEIRKFTDDEGKEYEVLTIEEALTEILTKVTEIHKAL